MEEQHYKSAAKTLMLSGVLTLCFGTPLAQAAPEVMLRAAHAAPTTNTGHKALEYLNEKLQETTDGRVGIDIYPGAQLGGERELIEGIQLGNIDMTYVSSAPLASFNKQFYVFDIPFLFKDREAAYRVLDGGVGQDVLDSLKDVGMEGLGYWENGFRQLTNSEHEVHAPEDVQGMKMRTMENELHIETWKDIGANPAPLSFSELFTALQQDTFDAQEGPLNLFYDMRFYEVQDYITMTNHVYSPWPVLINPMSLAPLSEDDKAAFYAAFEETTEYQRGLAREADEAAKEAMTDVTITELSDDELDAFKEKVTPVIDMVKAKVGEDIVNKVIETANES